jgi:hypothetical protein
MASNGHNHAISSVEKAQQGEGLGLSSGGECASVPLALQGMACKGGRCGLRCGIGRLLFGGVGWSGLWQSGMQRGGRCAR